MFIKLLEMSFTSGVLLLIVIFIRACLFKKLPKKVFVLLWLIVLFKLLVPVSLSSGFSIYSIIESTENYTLKKASDSIGKNNSDKFEIMSSIENIMILEMLGILSFIVTIMFSILLCFRYIKIINLFKTSIHIKNHEFVEKWICENSCFRRLIVCISEFTRTPLTSGILKPRIILPKKMDYANNQTLDFVLTHEMVHINSFDNMLKLFMIVALAIHWFNPLVWVMFFLLNKDIEFSCDEKVINIIGEEYRADYATTLISLAEENNPFSMSMYSGFGKTKIEERIVNVMKFKKSTYVTFLVSTVLICGTSLVFATGNKEINEVESFDLYSQKVDSYAFLYTSARDVEISSSISKTSKSYSYISSEEYSVQKSGYDENVLVISRKGDFLSVNKVQYRTSIKEP
ncbi:MULTISPECIES: M56 family metallopeptidase [unclassified Clostridioides]|uniref:M56 family metallopeptidase n=1 Tax=unclassified Clostridioides TaxID=2635829 RepID=UPI001D120ED5|nr:M56 family metallopeptidase [Clostridioides sp. ES-S-0171-01]MCC0686563.1 M56 family metallopeptidase [Clostridioides sp. ES-S-0056-01]MCC0713917.1 M56 family metallopeptidase [Clostridioides sp. ES-S-0077-01]UDN55147.1 M56 family metallopeptidase [Clostridioides sp. ES-S-0054-01]